MGLDKAGLKLLLIKTTLGDHIGAERFGSTTSTILTSDRDICNLYISLPLKNCLPGGCSLLLSLWPFVVPSPSLPPYYPQLLSFLPLPPSPSLPSLSLPLPRGSVCDDHCHWLSLVPTGRRGLRPKSVHRFYKSPANMLLIASAVACLLKTLW